MTTPDIRSRDAERGMTLVELLVAMFILAIVMAMVVRMLGDATSAKNSVQVDTSTARAIDTTMEQLATDLRMAVNPYRDAASAREIKAGITQAGVDTREVLMAQPFELRLVANVVPATNTYECIIYRVDTQGSLWRAISADTFGCSTAGASLLDLRRMMRGRDAALSEAAGRGEFLGGRTYEHEASKPAPAMMFGYVALQRRANLDACALIKLPNGPVFRADYARMMSVNLVAFDVREQKSTLAALTPVYDDTVTLRAHATLRHRMDVGCGRSDLVDPA